MTKNETDRALADAILAVVRAARNAPDEDAALLAVKKPVFELVKAGIRASEEIRVKLSS